MADDPASAEAEAPAAEQPESGATAAVPDSVATAADKDVSAEGFSLVSRKVPSWPDGHPDTIPVNKSAAMEGNAVFDALATELRGEVVMPKPVVSQEVIVKALRQHTVSLKKSINEIGAAKVRITGVEKQCDELRGLIGQCNARMDAMDKVIAQCQADIRACEEKLEEAMKKLEKIDELEAICAEHTRQIAAMEAEQERAKAEFAAYKVDVAEQFEKERSERRAVDERLKTLEDYVMNRLTVTTDQVICLHTDDAAAAARASAATAAGASGGGAAAVDAQPAETKADDSEHLLTLVLKTTAKDVAANRDGVLGNKKLLKKHTEEIAHKAGAHIEPIVEEHAKHIKELIEVTGAGGGGSRMADLEARVAESMKGVKNCSTLVDGLKEQLLEKCDKAHVDEKVESKYEEIIDHLQGALSSAGEDEDEFKRVSMELQEICQRLAATKADKRDLLEVKEQVLFDSRVREQVDQLREFVDLKMNKDDVKQGLDTKPDRAELELRIKELSSLMKRSIKKAVAASGDEDGTGALSTQQMSTAPGGTKKNPMYADLVWKKGGAPLAPHVPVAQLVAPSFGGGFNLGSMNMARPGDTAPPLRPGRHGQAAGTDLLPMMPREQDMPAHNPSNNLVVGVDGLIYHGGQPKGADKMMSASGPAT